MMINFLIFCFPVPRKQFFQMCLLINTVLSGLSIFFIFGNGLSIYYIMTGFIGLVDFTISLIVQIKQRNDSSLQSKHNKIFAVSQIPLNIGFFFCQTMQRIEEIQETNNGMKIPFWITAGVLLFFIYCYYVYYIHKVVGVCCSFEDVQDQNQEILVEEFSEDNNQLNFQFIMINFLVCCLPVTREKFFYILVILSTVFSAISLFSIFNGGATSIVYGLLQLAYFGLCLNAWIRYNRDKDHTTINQHLYAYGFVLSWILDIVYFCLTYPHSQGQSESQRTIVMILTTVILILGGGYYSYYLLVSVEAMPEKYRQQINDNSRTEEYLEEDLTN